jgi:hypothetical protein
MLFGNNQEMNRRMRFDILENHQIFVFVKQFCGCFFLSDVAEYTIRLHKKSLLVLVKLA